MDIIHRCVTIISTISTADTKYFIANLKKFKSYFHFIMYIF